MKKLAILLTLTLTILSAKELEKDIQYLGNDGVRETHKVICKNAKSKIIYIDNKTKQISSKDEKFGKATLNKAVERICN